MKKSIYLCGFMGAGKTTAGLEAARLLGYRFVDLDRYIEKTERMTVSEIFREKGEPYFRQKETEAVLDFADKGSTVIATGGGTMINPKNAEIVANRGVVIYIKVPFYVCYSRIAKSSVRPLVQSNSKEQLEELYNTREPIYQKHANVTIDGVNAPLECAKAIYTIAAAL